MVHLRRRQNIRKNLLRYTTTSTDNLDSDPMSRTGASTTLRSLIFIHAPPEGARGVSLALLPGRKVQTDAPLTHDPPQSRQRQYQHSKDNTIRQSYLLHHIQYSEPSRVDMADRTTVPWPKNTVEASPKGVEMPRTSISYKQRSVRATRRYSRDARTLSFHTLYPALYSASVTWRCSRVPHTTPTLVELRNAPVIDNRTIVVRDRSCPRTEPPGEPDGSRARAPSATRDLRLSRPWHREVGEGG